MHKLASSLAALVLLFATAPAALAAGKAVGVDPAAEARGAKVRTLVVGADVFIGDRIVTNGRGLVQILFDDKTKLVVGPGSALLIEDYLVRDNGSAGKLAVNALSGTFRFITGGSAKSKYVITTPTGQIGVRGTAFDLYVTKSATYVLQLQGTTINCARSGDCETMSARCDIGVISRGDVDVGALGELDRGDRDKARGWFRYAVSQSALLRPFRVNGAERCFRRAAEPAESIGTRPNFNRNTETDGSSDGGRFPGGGSTIP